MPITSSMLLPGQRRRIDGGVQIVVILLRLPLAHCGDQLYCRHRMPGYRHVTLLALMVGVGALVQDYNGVLKFPEHEMQLEVGASGCPPWIALNQAVYGHGNLREGHPLFLWLKEIQWLWQLPSMSLLSILNLDVEIHVFHGQLCSTPFPTSFPHQL